MSSRITSRLGDSPVDAVKAPVKVMSTSNLTLSGLQTVNGVSLEAGDRILVAGQDAPADNGIYVVKSDAWIRASDWDKDEDVVNGVMVLVENEGKLYKANLTGQYNVGSTAVTFDDLPQVQVNGMITETVTASGSQTVFTTTQTYVPGTNTLMVYVDGVLQSPSAYVETDGNTVTFNSPVPDGSEVMFRILNMNTITTVDATNVTYTDTNNVTTTVKAALDKSPKKVKLTGDMSGESTFDSAGEAVISTVVGVPTVTELNGGNASTVYEPVPNGPYGVINSPAQPTAQKFCPGYTYVRDSDSAFHVDGIDLRGLYTPNRSVEITIGSSVINATVATSDYDTTVAGGTYVSLNLTGGDVISADPSAVCLIPGSEGWSPVTNPFPDGSSINDIRYGKIGTTPYLVAVGDGGIIATSTDGGLNWSQVTSDTTERLRSVAYDWVNEAFMVVGENFTVLTSNDGVSWNSHVTNFASLQYSSDPGNQILDSAGFDGTRWSVSYHRKSTDTFRNLAYSIDGDTWTLNSYITLSVNTKIEYNRTVYNGDHLFISGGTSGSGIYAMSDFLDTQEVLILSTTGTLWGFEVIPGGDEDLFVIDETGTCSKVINGTPDTTWNSAYSTLNTFAQNSITPRSVALDTLTGNTLVMVGDNGTISTSLDQGITWQSVNNGFNPVSKINRVEYDETNHKFVAVSNDGKICVSTTGIN